MTDIELRDEGAVPEPAPAAATPAMLPGELRPHPTPVQYVVIALILVVITSFEVSLFYLEGTIPNAAIIPLLLVSAALKFGLVASWYMHLRTDRPIFARFFILGIVAAVCLYLIVLSSLSVFS
ncbi:MAG TPA: cytochrome C oxidase subunit IV family protein [Acidimicrobiia bacterium]|nr:cytochrome C oxidase subunit IV family protein [Acidimicrobiia bacterium]